MLLTRSGGKKRFLRYVMWLEAKVEEVQII